MPAEEALDGSVDVAIIGGGINGAGVARDLAMRGLAVALFEKRDIATGATGGSSGMIHGGPRYLTRSRRVTRHSCEDAGHIRRIAPHLVFRIPFLMPVFRGPGARVRLELYATFFEAYDRFQPLKGGKPSALLTAEEAYALEPGLAKGVVGAVTFDEWGVDPFRLAVANAVDAARRGARVRAYTRVTGLLREGGRVAGVRWHDDLSHAAGETRARCTLNLAGPWSPEIAALAGERVRLRPAKGTHLILDRRIANVGLVCNAVDGRSIFLIPHENSTLIGTTDDDYYGDLDQPRATEDDIQYLLQGMEFCFPAVRRYRVMRVMCAVRPTLWGEGRYEDDLSRDYRVFDHEERGAPGLWTMTGGKLAAYRLMAQDLADRVAAKLGNTVPCRTHLTPLPGGETAPTAAALASEIGAPRAVAARALFRWGSEAPCALDGGGAAPGVASPAAGPSGKAVSPVVEARDRGHSVVCQCEPVTEAEVRHAIRGEFVRRASDLRRRCHVGTGPCQGTRCTLRVASILGEETGADGAAIIAQAVELLRNRWKGHAAIASGAHLAQLQLKHAWLVGTANLDRLGG